MSLADLTRDSVLRALAEYDSQGRDAFLARYGFGVARSYFLIHEGKIYDSKAIAGVAHGFLPGKTAFRPTDFAGGEMTVRRALTKLGFTVEGPPGAAATAPQHWAFFANPNIYRIDEALQRRTEDTWVTADSDIHDGDLAVIWRGRGRDGRRGVVALAEVTSDPLDLDDSANPFWVEPQRPSVEKRVQIRYSVPDGLPLWLDANEAVLAQLSVTRARGGTVFKITPTQWDAIIDLVGGWSPPRSRPIGRPYAALGWLAPSVPREPFDVDPDRVDRGSQAHATTQDALGTFLQSMGIEPRSPAAGEPEFDMAWTHDGVVYVAEVKSITDANEEKQLRLGLGQVLRYRQGLTSVTGRPVVAVLVPERRPLEHAWLELAAELGVKLAWPEEFERVFRPDN